MTGTDNAELRIEIDQGEGTSCKIKNEDQSPTFPRIPGKPVSGFAMIGT